MKRFFEPGKVQYRGILDEMVRFAMDHQLMNGQTWKDFVEVFRSDSDTPDMGWRCEYWGKMMRGAVMTYQYNADEGLYRVLEDTVRDLLTTQRSDGRFSTYSDETQLSGGWDVWGRKYILTGGLHFYRICRDEALKHTLLEALKKHADALVQRVGDQEGQVSVFKTSNHWLGVNSCSVLEPMIDLYKETGEKRYLQFAEYLIRTGGCEEADLIELALTNGTRPYLYPETKAYETMSFFEGVLAYYEVTGEEKYLQAVLKFVEDVDASDITVIGCSGCTHELFDHSGWKQVLYSDMIMQETCVTVTWMRLLARLYQRSGEVRYIDRIETAAYNALYGSVNNYQLKQYSIFDKEYVDPLPFDSYSPLYAQSRGKGIGGFKRFSFGGYYGCCACIASAGIALAPLCAAVVDGDAIVINSPASGILEIKQKDGEAFLLEAETAFPEEAGSQWTIRTKTPEERTILLRIPDYLCEVQISVNGLPANLCPVDGYAKIRRIWKDGDVLSLSGEMEIRVLTLQGKKAFLYGPLVLTRDAAKEDGNADLTEALDLQNMTEITEKIVRQASEGTETVSVPEEILKRSAWMMLPKKELELVRIQITLADGKQLLLTDYQSCGKRWLNPVNRLTVWFNSVK